MNAPLDSALDLPRAGLCATCCHAEILRSKRSAYLRCARAARDPHFPRYPGLPVLACRGFEAGVEQGPARGPGLRAPDG